MIVNYWTRIAWDHYQGVQMLDNVLMFPQYPQLPHKYTIWNWHTTSIFHWNYFICINTVWGNIDFDLWTLLFFLIFSQIYFLFLPCVQCWRATTDTGWSGILTIVCRISDWSQGISLQQLWSVRTIKHTFIYVKFIL